MTPDPYFFDTKIKGIPYLLPFGQGIANHQRGLRTNESGLLLWEGLCQGEDRAALLRRFCDFYEAGPGEEETLARDLDDFLKLLRERGLILENAAADVREPSDTVVTAAGRGTAPANEGVLSSHGTVPADGCNGVHADGKTTSLFPRRFIKIGPLTLALRIPDEVYHRYFSAFAAYASDTKKEDARIDADMSLVLLSCRPGDHAFGKVLVRSVDMLIADTGEEYLFAPRQGNYVYELRVSRDASRAVLYSRFEGTDPECAEEIFHIIRFAFLMTAQAHDLCVVHSASLLHEGKAWLFSGHSGAGKSTHTKLWHDNFGSLLLNGDLNLLGMEKGQPVCFGLPWCGTSEIFTAENYPLGGVVFLKQAPVNRVLPLSPDLEALSLTQRMITPAWTRDQAQKNLALAEILTDRIRVFLLECTKDPEAAEVMRKAIENTNI